jgi:prephenate dehydratase
MIAFQGEHGAYSEAAIFEHFCGQPDTLPCESFDQVFERVAGGTCELGFIPIENSLAGSIHRNYDLLLQNQLVVTGEHNQRIEHCLIGLPGASMEGVRTVISHPQALAQCEQSLKRLGLRPEPVYDTAGSVKMVLERGDPSVAAVASRRAADLYKMAILAEGIEDHPANYTRFLLIAREPVSPGVAAKTSIVFALDNRPGALYRALSVFALRDIDLTKMESRPLAGKPWEYFFYVDFTGAADDRNCQNALNHLREFATFLRVLGSYPRFQAGKTGA